MIALKVIVGALAQYLGTRLWPPINAYLHRARWPRRIAYPWMVFVLVAPALLFKWLNPRLTWGECSQVTALLYYLLVLLFGAVFLAYLALLWCVDGVIGFLTRKPPTQTVLPPSAPPTTPAPFLRRVK